MLSLVVSAPQVTLLSTASSTPQTSCRSDASGYGFSHIAEAPGPHLKPYWLTPQKALRVLETASRHRKKVSPILLEALLCSIRRG